MGRVHLMLPLAALCFIHSVRSQAEFPDLPNTVDLPESSAPGALVHSFTLVNCSSSNPTVTISRVSPSATYFNSPSQTRAGTDAYDLKITLSSSAALNADVVNAYTLEITAQCGNDTATAQIFLQIIDDIPEPQCDPLFSSQVGDAVQVYSNVPASSIIYTVVLRQPKNNPVTYKVTLPSPSPFTISASGNVFAPASGFSNTAATYRLQIMVIDRLGNTCNGTLTVTVLTVYNNPVNFTSSSVSATIQENGGPNQMVTTVKAQGSSVLYELTTPSAAFYVESASGTIRTTYNLDLDKNHSLLSTVLLVRAYDRYQRSNSATVTVTITVLDVNDIAPQCSPAIVVNVYPQSQPVLFTIEDFTCTDPDYNSTALSYSITPNVNSLYSFRMQGSSLQINSSLNYDSYQMASVNFQFAASVVVTDSGAPRLSTSIPVFITVTAVNDFPPVCVGPFSFTVNENTGFGIVVGQINATDADYPFNSVQFSIEGGPNPPIFYVIPGTGELKLLGPLDFETTSSYSLKIKVVDLNNDIVPDPEKQKTAFCSVTVSVSDYNDNPPVCSPPFSITTIYSTLLTTTPFLTLSCSDKDVTSVLTYNIVGGNINSRFRMVGPSLLHNGFSFNADGLMDPQTYELLVQVTDSVAAPQFSTTATVFVTVIPWTTTKATTTKTTVTPEKQTIIVNKTLEYWQPDVWFMVVLTITGILFLSAIALLTWVLCQRSSFCAQGTKDLSQPLLPVSSDARNEAVAEAPNPHPPSKEKKDIAPVSPLSLQFDGRAQDPVSGREYLFNSHTGERRWL
ncbi:LOW QUALITY PROTEIN: cadherin-related family member 4 [Dendrobates tinctorius]|uniref:LOW QUALITY PROTEIN: cadherin-related family member 4 n=1 Tax=Dendrobates tinctorius TaxID=92724 RepID=UPI003CC9A368